LKKVVSNQTRAMIVVSLLVFLISNTFLFYFINLKFREKSTECDFSTSSLHIYDINFSWNGSDYDYCSDIAVDSLGNIYVVGSTYSYGEGLEDIILLKFTNSRNLEWFTTWGGNNYDYGLGVALDSLGNIYVTGRTSISTGNEDVVIIKFDNHGNQIWNRTWGGTTNDYGNDIVIDTNNNIYIVGRTGAYDALLLKYNVSGFLIWEEMWDTGNNDEGKRIYIDSQNDIYISGETENDVFFAKYNSSGIYQWNKTWGGNYYDGNCRIAIDSFDNIYTGITTNTAENDCNVLLQKYNSSGILLSEITIETSDEEYIKDLAVDEMNNLYLNYQREGENADNFLIKFNQYGTVLSNRSIFYIDFFTVGIKFDSFDNLFVYGEYYDEETTLDILIFRYGSDYDEDGLSNWQEINVYFTDPLNADTDGDFLNDWDELNTYNTNPFINDTDNDGLLDGHEISIYFTDPLNSDTDGDTIIDGDEVNIYGTNPNLKDSDGDGFEDNLEIFLGFNPNDRESNPIFLIVIISLSLIILLCSMSFIVIQRKKKSKMLREKEAYNKIPNLKILIRNYVYHQLREIQNDLAIHNLELKNLDEKIKKQLDMNIGNFLKFLELDDIQLTKNQISFLKVDSFAESEPIRKEITQIIKQRLEEKGLEGQRSVFQKELHNKLQKTNDPALKEIIKKEYQEKLKSFQTIEQKIDNLLNHFASWDTSEGLKKL
jgi:hypothetical protein